MRTTGDEAVKLIADVALLAEGHVLLVRYKDGNKYDHQKGWFLPDDLLTPLEHPGKAAQRVLQEQLGLAAPSLRLSHIESFRGNDRSWHLSFHYAAELEGRPALAASKDVETATWFPLSQLPSRAEVAHRGWALDVIKRMTAA